MHAVQQLINFYLLRIVSVIIWNWSKRFKTRCERVSVAYRQFSNFSAISWRGQVNFQSDNDEVRFVLEQHPELHIDSASSLKQQSAGRHVAPLGHIILIPSQPVFALSPECCVHREATHTNVIVLVWPDRCSNTRSTALEASTLTISPPMWFLKGRRVRL
jgi:hypothetical protein